VKKAIDDMVEELLAQSADEIKHRDSCIDELNKNEVSTQEKLHAQKSQEEQIEGLKITIKDLTHEIETLTAEITELGVQKERATEDRAAEHAEFQGVVSDQRETQAMLTKARNVLLEYYRGEGRGDAFVQGGKQAPPEGFKTYEKQGANGVLDLLQNIIADAKEMEAETTHAEEQAEKAFNKFVAETDASVEAKQDEVVNKNAAKAQAEGDLTETKDELAGTVTDLENLATTAAAAHKSCDYFLKNFDVRQEARTEEVQALRQAKAILSGMK
jgi:archaellum component FlaC